MVQPFLTEVDTYGERGCVYFNGQFGHAFSRHVVLVAGGQDAAVLSAPEKVGSAELSASERMVADRVNDWLTDRFGSLPLATILGPAIRLANDGFPASPLMIGALHQAADQGRVNLGELADQATRRGSRVRRPGVAAALGGIVGKCVAVYGR